VVLRAAPKHYRLLRGAALTHYQKKKTTVHIAKF
jgi:hypothetical protein